MPGINAPEITNLNWVAPGAFHSISNDNKNAGTLFC